jgi:TM2 domain-containing membrane protein YozV
MKQKICYVSAVVLILLLTCESYPQTLPHNNFKLKESSRILLDSQKTQLSEKSPLLAGTLSFIVPGLAMGQFYNAQYLKGVLHVAISGLAFVIFFSGFDVGGGSGEHPTAYAGFVLYLGNWIYTTFEAIASAEKINKEIMLQKYRSGLLDKFKFGFTFDHDKKLRLNFAIGL